MGPHSTHEESAGSSDEDLVRDARGGDLAAFERLVSRHERRIYTLGRRITGSDTDAEDVTQQTFLSAIEHLAEFQERAAFATWLTSIAARAALKIVRKRRGLPTISLDEATGANDEGQVPHPEYIAEWREGPDRLAQRRETRQLLDDAIAELAPAYRAVFLLRDVEGLSVRDTATALRVSEGNVKVRLLRARLHLRERLTRVFGDGARRIAPEEHGHATAGRAGRKPHG